MKILKQFTKKPSREQILSWLWWIKSNCGGVFCAECKYYEVTCDTLSCKVLASHKEVRIGGCPSVWRLPKFQWHMEEPESLSFLEKRDWAAEGNPILPEEEE